MVSRDTGQNMSCSYCKKCFISAGYQMQISIKPDGNSSRWMSKPVRKPYCIVHIQNGPYLSRTSDASSDKAGAIACSVVDSRCLFGRGLAVSRDSRCQSISQRYSFISPSLAILSSFETPKIVLSVSPIINI